MLQGYQGLVDGGDNIKEVFWYDVSGIIQQVQNNEFGCCLSYIFPERERKEETL